MAQANEVVAGLLQEYAELLQISGGDRFRARNYEKAAKSVAGYSTDVGLLDEAGLRKIPGVGASIAAKIVQFQTTGTIAALEDLRATIPDGVREMTRIPALGPKRAFQLYSELGIRSISELATAIDEGRLRDLRGFGPKSEDKLRHGIELARTASERVTLNVAADTAARIVAAISAVPGCERCEHAGSLRRYRETIGDIDVLAAARDSGPLMEALTSLDGVTEVIARGDTKTSVRIATGAGHPVRGSTGSGGGADTIQVDLRVVAPECWGAALQYFTGSQAHNVAIREIAVRQKLKLSEYGLFDVETGDLIVSATEEEVYHRLGMEWVPPPLRENNGEVQAAMHGDLPTLVQVSDIRGDLHTHTNLTDGVATLDEMVATARARGYEYFAVTDHAPNLFMQRMTTEKMLEQRDQVRKLEARMAGDGDRAMTLLHGTELNIAADGTVDWPDDILAGFDLCVASVHSHFDQSQAEMTRRFLRACENPQVNIIGHPSARRIGKRPPVDVDWNEVFRACTRTGTALEVNCHPERLDLPSDLIKAARDAGVRFSVDTDSHATGHLDFLRYGVGTAQRGWLTPDDVINTWPLGRLRTFLSKAA
ncbi:MAG TPA: DNA polymerase/3'-5' exonuclease PolX [Streptosporangiaceae bacterium]